MALFDRPYILFAFSSNCGSILYYFWESDILAKNLIISYPLHSMPALGWGSQSKYCHTVWYWKKSEWWKKFDDMFSRFDRISTCDRRTDKRTDILRQHSLHS